MSGAWQWFFNRRQTGVLASSMWRRYSKGLADLDVAINWPLQSCLSVSAVNSAWLVPLLLAWVRVTEAPNFRVGG